MLICDDGSTDSTPQIVRGFIEKYHLDNWNFSVNTVNLGCCRNFVETANKTKGDIIFFSDQDDIWDKDKIKIMAGLMENDPQIHTLVCNKSFIDKDNNILAAKVYKGYKINVLTKISAFAAFHYRPMSGMTMAIRRKIADILSDLYEQWSTYMGHDWACACFGSLANGFYFYNAVLAHHRQHDANLTASIKPVPNRNDNQRIIEFDYQIKSYNSLLDFLNMFSKENRCINEKRHLISLINFYKRRVKNLETQNLLSAVLMLRYVPKYFAFRTCLGDIAYLLNLEKYFK